MSAQAHSFTGTEISTGRRKPSEIVAEYDAKREALAGALAEFEAAGTTLKSAAISRAAEHHGVTVAEIKGRSRLGHVVAARQDVFLALREAGWSFPRIGRAMGRDHSTVMHGVARALVVSGHSVDAGNPGLQAGEG